MEGGVSAIHKGLWLLFILGLVIVADWLMPVYGFSAERASWVWRGVQLGTSLLAIGLVVMLLVKVEVHVQTQGSETDTDTETRVVSVSEPTDTRVKIQKPVAQLTAGAEGEEGDSALYETLNWLRHKQGVVSQAAQALNVSPAAVNKRMRKLYEQDRAAVERDAPEWVERNIGSKAE
jgi:hypothetical protein